MKAALAAILARPDLLPVDKAAAAAIAVSAGPDGLCRLTLRQLCAAAGLPDRTLRRALATLVEAGAAIPTRVPGEGTVWRLADPSGHTRPGSAADGRSATHGRGRSPVAGRPPMAGRPPTATPASEINDLPAPPEAAAGPPPQTPPNSPPGNSSPVVEEKGGAGGKRRVPTTLPSDFAPSERLLAHIREHYPLVDASRELSAFRLYWLEGKGKGKLKSDWQGAFRIWCEKAQAWTEERRLAAGGAAAPGGARAPSPPPAPRQESEGIQRLREIIAEAQARKRRSA